MTTDADWRGVKAEDDDDLPPTVSIRLQDRSRRLLGSLLAPHKRTLVWVFAAVVVENVARLSVPYLVAVGIDKGIPPIVDHNDVSVLLKVIGLVVLAVIL